MSSSERIITADRPVDVATIGGKALSLYRLREAGFDVPACFVVTDAASGPEELRRALERIGSPDDLFAVRSSAVEEDSAGQSFAGQFESYLAVPAERVAERIADVRASGFTERVRAYRREQGLAGEPTPPAVLVQRLVRPDASGVAFSADPVTGRRGVAVVSAVPGLGTALVGGEADADAFHIEAEGRIIERRIARKTFAHRADPEAADGLRVENLDAASANQPAITDEQAVAVAALARDVARHLGGPQDIEWAFEGDRLWLLQSRPITTLRQTPDPDGRRIVWDNSNIIESYPGITLPLTYTFARHAYEQVYREFCQLMGVSRRRIDDQAEVFRHMIGLIRGRVYYNLLNWYRLLALLPGFKANRSFMEQMMGVREPLPDEVLEANAPPGRLERWGDRLALGRTVAGMVWRHATLERDIRRFYARLDRALVGGDRLARMRIDELATEYRRLERELLTRWDAPLVNDFFAMIHFGLLGKLTERYTGQAGLHNALLANAGGMISAEPAQRIAAMAELAADDERLVDRLRHAEAREAEDALAAHPPLQQLYREYLARFGERCLEELKLESATLVDDPTPLLRSIGHTAGRLRSRAPAAANEAEASPTAASEQAVDKALRGKPIRRRLFRWVLRQARARVTARENLRFERTRVFGRVRRIFVEIGRRLVAEGRLDDHRDVFQLETEEVLGFIEGSATSDDLQPLVAARRAAYERFHRDPPPPERFETRGAVGLYETVEPTQPVGEEPPSNSSADGATLQGTGCCAGRVTGRARVITDPVGAEVREGEILVAERTDPGWIMLFPAAAGVLVQRGSMLSHSAIVARELGIPAIVSIPDLMRRVRTGDRLEMDGSSGRVTVVEPTDKADADAQ